MDGLVNNSCTRDNMILKILAGKDMEGFKEKESKFGKATGAKKAPFVMEE